MSDHDVSCPRCKALRGQNCVTPKGMAVYRRVTVGRKRIRVHAVHEARKRRSVVIHNYFSEGPGAKRFVHQHPAVYRAERPAKGAVVLHVWFGQRKARCQ